MIVSLTLIATARDRTGGLSVSIHYTRWWRDGREILDGVTRTVVESAALDDDVKAVAELKVVQSVLEVVCRTTGMGFSAVARVTDTRWIACAVRDEIQFGLAPGGELPLQTTICDEIRQSGRLVAIDDVAEDERYRDHQTPKMYGFRSYISVPLRLPDGRFFGTLCAIDPRPARVNNPQTIGMFRLFAELIGMHLHSQDRLTVSEAALVSAHAREELQNQFVAVLGHDLRNPLSAIQAGGQLLKTQALDARAARVVDVIDRSAARMSSLIGNLLDFARTRLGGGVNLQVEDADLAAALAHIVAETRTSQPDREIRVDSRIEGPIRCDPVRIGQLFSNLLSNALAHGEPGTPVAVSARGDGGVFEFAVINHCPPIPAETLKRLFQPYIRGESSGGSEGLGLGLYIASEIARAHGGTLTATSTPAETRFTFRMPMATGR